MPIGQSTYTWAASTTDPRALQTADGTSRIAACWFAGPSFTVDVNLTDGQAHNLALYAVDWDHLQRGEQIQISDAGTGAVLDTQTLGSFTEGVYLDWKVSGHVVITVTRLSGPNVVLSGLFFDPMPTMSGLAAPTLVMTPQMLDATLRTAVLTRPVNRFERM